MNAKAEGGGGGKGNRLNAAKAAKADEFYTQWADVEREMNAYTEYDSPGWSRSSWRLWKASSVTRRKKLRSKAHLMSLPEARHLSMLCAGTSGHFERPSLQRQRVGVPNSKRKPERWPARRANAAQRSPRPRLAPSACRSRSPAAPSDQPARAARPVPRLLPLPHRGRLQDRKRYAADAVAALHMRQAAAINLRADRLRARSNKLGCLSDRQRSRDFVRHNCPFRGTYASILP